MLLQKFTFAGSVSLFDEDFSYYRLFYRHLKVQHCFSPVKPDRHQKLKKESTFAKL